MHGHWTKNNGTCVANTLRAHCERFYRPCKTGEQTRYHPKTLLFINSGPTLSLFAVFHRPWVPSDARARGSAENAASSTSPREALIAFQTLGQSTTTHNLAKHPVPFLSGHHGMATKFRGMYASEHMEGMTLHMLVSEFGLGAAADIPLMCRFRRISVSRFTVRHVRTDIAECSRQANAHQRNLCPPFEVQHPTPRKTATQHTTSTIMQEQRPQLANITYKVFRQPNLLQRRLKPLLLISSRTTVSITKKYLTRVFRNIAPPSVWHPCNQQPPLEKHIRHGTLNKIGSSRQITIAAWSPRQNWRHIVPQCARFPMDLLGMQNQNISAHWRTSLHHKNYELYVYFVQTTLLQHAHLFPRVA